MPTILLLLTSNIFMTTAWYWHLKGGMDRPLPLVILISWGIAFIEYCFAVPANRIGYAHGWSGGQLKIAQEAITLTVFGFFMVWVSELCAIIARSSSCLIAAFSESSGASTRLENAPGEPLHWRHFAAFACIMAAVGFLFVGK